MKYISTLDLRNKSSKLIQSLKDGESTYLIYRSKVVAEIKPLNTKAPVVFNAKEFNKLTKSLLKDVSIPKDYSERDKIYREHLERKYGKDLS